MKLVPILCALCIICAACGLAACMGPAQLIGSKAARSAAARSTGASGAATPAVDPQNLQTATLAGGCFWSMQRMLDALPGVMESAIIGLDHADFGEAVTAVVVCAKDAALDEASVIAALSGRLAKFKLPKRVLFVDDLPRNAMGKVQKAKLRETYAGLYKTTA